MKTKKKILLSAVAVYVLGATAAYAQLDVQVNLGGPAYVAPVATAPVYVRPYPANYDPGHRDHDFAYWRDHKDHRDDDHHDDHRR